MHIHGSHPDGEAKFLLQSTIEAAENVVLSPSTVDAAAC